MDNSFRLQYLQAMGITVWMTRIAPSESIISPPESNAEFKVTLDFGSVDNDANVIKEPILFDDHQTAWTELEAEVSVCTQCDLCKTRTQTVFGTGKKTADWMIIGEAPGQHEDEQGKPFVGKAGALLTEMLRAIGLDRDDVFITNILKCRPPGNRDPKPEEAESCSEYLRRQRALVNPKIILAVGRIAAQTLLNSGEPLARLRSKVHNLDNIPVVVVYHPAYLLRSLLEKRKAWQDLLLAVKILNEDKSK